MNPKDARSRWLAGLSLISAIGLGFAIYHATSRPVDDASAPRPIEHQLHDNATNDLNPPPAVGPSASAPINPLTFLLGHRRQRGSTEQAIPNALDPNEPVLAAGENPSVAAPPGSSTPLGRTSAQSLATDTAPPGVPMPAANLGRNSEASRVNAPPAAPH
jgi:hypothetical protein